MELKIQQLQGQQELELELELELEQLGLRALTSPASTDLFAMIMQLCFHFLHVLAWMLLLVLVLVLAQFSSLLSLLAQISSLPVLLVVVVLSPSSQALVQAPEQLCALHSLLSLLLLSLLLLVQLLAGAQPSRRAGAATHGPLPQLR